MASEDVLKSRSQWAPYWWCLTYSAVIVNEGTRQSWPWAENNFRRFRLQFGIGIKWAKIKICMEKAVKWICLNIREIHFTHALLGAPHQYQAGSSFAFRSALIHCGIKVAEIFGLFWNDGINQWLQSCTSMMRTSWSTLPKGAGWGFSEWKLWKLSPLMPTQQFCTLNFWVLDIFLFFPTHFSVKLKDGRLANFFNTAHLVPHPLSPLSSPYWCCSCLHI